MLWSHSFFHNVNAKLFNSQVYCIKFFLLYCEQISKHTDRSFHEWGRRLSILFKNLPGKLDFGLRLIIRSQDPIILRPRGSRTHAFKRQMKNRAKMPKCFLTSSEWMWKCLPIFISREEGLNAGCYIELLKQVETCATSCLMPDMVRVATSLHVKKQMGHLHVGALHLECNAKKTRAWLSANMPGFGGSACKIKLRLNFTRFYIKRYVHPAKSLHIHISDPSSRKSL